MGVIAPEDHMNTSPAPGSYELRFESLCKQGGALTFPCDSAGNVDMDSLCEHARHRYLYARALVGREFSVPAVCADEQQ